MNCVHICRACNGYGFLKSMSVCRCCYGSGTDSATADDNKDLSEKVKDIIENLTLSELVSRLLFSEAMLIADEDMDYHAVIRSLETETCEGGDPCQIVNVKIDVLVRLEPPELKLCSVMVKRVYKMKDMVPFISPVK